MGNIFRFLMVLSMMITLVGCDAFGVNTTVDAEEQDEGETTAPSQVDNDDDGYPPAEDCNDSDPNINTATAENCVNGVDDDCDFAIDAADTECAPATPTPEDDDDDGDVDEDDDDDDVVDEDDDDYTIDEGDCDDDDPDTNPGVDYDCDGGGDNDCDDDVDEDQDENSCDEDEPDDDDDAHILVYYSDTAYRVLYAQVYYDADELGDWWDEQSSSTTDSVDAWLDADDYDWDKACGIRLNVAENSPATDWLCEGNGATATLDSDADVWIEANGETFTEDDLEIWSAATVSLGCSALLVFTEAGDCNLP